MKLRVVEVVGRLSHGGAEHLVTDIASRLDQKQFDVNVWCVSDTEVSANKDMLSHLRRTGVSVKFFGKRPRKDYVRVIRGLVLAMRETKPDIVHVHLENYSLYVALASLFYRNTMYCQTLHNTVLDAKPLLRMAWRAFDRTIAISNEVKAVATQELGIAHERIEILYNGIDPLRFPKDGEISDRLVTESSTGRRSVKLLCVGRLTKQKGHGILFEAIANLIHRSHSGGGLDQDVQLFMAGMGELKDELVELARRLDIADRVHFLGTTSNVAALLRGADIYMLPSLWEGLSLSLLEAMSIGTPIIATDVGSNAAALEHYTGSYELVHPGSASELTSAIERALIAMSSGELKRGSLPVGFSIQDCVRSHEQLFRRLAAKDLP